MAFPYPQSEVDLLNEGLDRALGRGKCSKCGRRRKLVPDVDLCSECNMAHLGPIADAIREFGENKLKENS